MVCKKGNPYMESDCSATDMGEQESTEKESTEKESTEKENTEKENTEKDDERIHDYGQLTLGGRKHKIHLLCIIGEIEGHEILSKSAKTTKYEHVLPQLAAIEDSDEIEGLLLLINTIGGAVESGLAIAEMIASLSKPTVSLVIGDSHSIGVPLAVATDYSYIVPSSTMIIHPVRMSGTVIGAPQTYDQFKLIQDRIAGFVARHSKISVDRFEEMMLRTGILTNDLGTILVGQDAVDEGIIDSTGGIHDAMQKLHGLIEKMQGGGD